MMGASNSARTCSSAAQQLQVGPGFGGGVIESVPGGELGNGHFIEGEMW
jgi:hypothetical protein